MDALSHALAKIRLTSPLIARMYLGDDVALHLGHDQPPVGACPFHYVIEGSARLACNDSINTLNAGDLMFLPRWPDYRIETGRADHRFGIQDLVADIPAPPWSPEGGLDVSLTIKSGTPPFTATLLGGICLFDQPHGASFLDNLPPVIVTNRLGQGMEGILGAVLSFIDGEQGQRPGYAATAARLLEALLVETLRSWTLSSTHQPGRLRGMNDPRLTGLLHHLHTQPGREWDLANMAALAGQSRSKFTSHFKTMIGVTPAAYLRQLRCEAAERRLLDGEAVATIAHELGYGSSFAFSRAFQKRTGMTPAQFRRAGGSRYSGMHSLLA